MNIIGISSGQSNQNNYLLLLEEAKSIPNEDQDKKRRLPIVIGTFEAQSIAIALEKVKIQRPISHDLFKNFADAFHLYVKEVIIYNLVEGVFYSKLICTNEAGDSEHEIDSRTSDAIAIAVRFEAPIYAYDFILDNAGYIVDDNNMISPVKEDDIEESTKTFSSMAGKPEEDDANFFSTIAEKSIEELQEELQKAIQEEKYEKAAKIHQEIEKREK